MNIALERWRLSRRAGVRIYSRSSYPKKDPNNRRYRVCISVTIGYPLCNMIAFVFYSRELNLPIVVAFVSDNNVTHTVKYWRTYRGKNSASSPLPSLIVEPQAKTEEIEEKQGKHRKHRKTCIHEKSIYV
jgi:hypothetical protein